jgi:hypothetical protein
MTTSNNTANKFKCKYCEKEFVRENSLAVHVCEQKKRYQEKGERGVQLGYQAWLAFYEYSQGSAKTKTWDHFAKSPYYKAFVKFGRYCVDIRAVHPKRFMDWLLKNNKKIDYWAKDSNYDEYLNYILKVEHPTDALKRAIEYSIEWGESKDADPKDVIRYGNNYATCQLITKGTLSPWVVYNSQSGQKFLSELTQDQQQIVWPYIDPEQWEQVFKKYPADLEFVKEALKQAGW